MAQAITRLETFLVSCDTSVRYTHFITYRVTWRTEVHIVTRSKH